MKSAALNPRSGRRILTGLLGAPIAHSASPAMHERAAEALGLRCHYQLVEVAGAGREELKVLLEGVRRLGFAGINVTFPYKEAVVDLLDELSPGAALIGAVNTVVNKDGRLSGDNTDVYGFATALLDVCPDAANRRVVLLGAGGAARAVAFALAEAGVDRLVIANRTHERARELAVAIGNSSVSAIAWDELDRADAFDLSGAVEPRGVGGQEREGVRLEHESGALEQRRQVLLEPPRPTPGSVAI